MGMQQKDLRKLCARLREDRLIAVYVQIQCLMSLGSTLINFFFGN